MRDIQNIWIYTNLKHKWVKNYQMPNKWRDYKIFELKYGNTKRLGNTKDNQVKLVLPVLVSAYLYQYSIKSY